MGIVGYIAAVIAFVVGLYLYYRSHRLPEIIDVVIDIIRIVGNLAAITPQEWQDLKTRIDNAPNLREVFNIIIAFANEYLAVAEVQSRYRVKSAKGGKFDASVLKQLNEISRCVGRVESKLGYKKNKVAQKRPAGKFTK